MITISQEYATLKVIAKKPASPPIDTNAYLHGIPDSLLIPIDAGKIDSDQVINGKLVKYKPFRFKWISLQPAVRLFSATTSWTEEHYNFFIRDSTGEMILAERDSSLTVKDSLKAIKQLLKWAQDNQTNNSKWMDRFYAASEVLKCIDTSGFVPEYDMPKFRAAVKQLKRVIK